MVARFVMTEALQTFCTEIAKGRTHVEAYRTAYPNSRAAVNSVKTEANKLLKRPEIVTRIAEMTQEGIRQASIEVAITKADVMRELWENSQIAKAAVPVLDREGTPIGEYQTNIAASNSALTAIGKELGMFKESAQDADPLDGLTHDEVKQVKALLNGFVGSDTGIRATPGDAPRGSRRAKH